MNEKNIWQFEFNTIESYQINYEKKRSIFLSGKKLIGLVVGNLPNYEACRSGKKVTLKNIFFNQNRTIIIMNSVLTLIC